MFSSEEQTVVIYMKQENIEKTSYLYLPQWLFISIYSYTPLESACIYMYIERHIMHVG